MAGATVQVLYDGTDITNKVLYQGTRFTTLANGMPGDFELRVKDPQSNLNFVTGKEVRVLLNGTAVFGGFALQISRTFAFPDKTAGARLWIIRGPDYNILFDKRVLRRPADYLHQVPNPSRTLMDGAALRYILSNFIDLDQTVWWHTDVDDVMYYNGDGTSKSAYPQQGTKLRECFEGPALRAGAIFYIDAYRHIHYHAYETVTNLWGFSDAPNNTTTFKMHDVTAVEDGSVIVNDALIWGGSQFAGANGGTVFARAQATTSQSLYSRWQIAETHFGEDGFKSQAGVNARANAIVNGPTGADATNALKGLRESQWQFEFSWWLQDVPSIPVPGHLFTISTTAFSVTRVLPLRSLTMTMPSLDSTGKAYVLMRGEFSLNVSDPYSLFAYLRKNRRTIINKISSANDSTEATVYGAYGSFTNITNVGGLTYKLPFGYIPSTLMVYAGGLALSPGSRFTETDPEEGTFTLTSSPSGVLYATCRTLNA